MWLSRVQTDPRSTHPLRDNPFALVLENVTIEDDGWYTCLVGNSVGYSHEFFWITVTPRTCSSMPLTPLLYGRTHAVYFTSENTKTNSRGSEIMPEPLEFVFSCFHYITLQFDGEQKICEKRRKATRLIYPRTLSIWASGHILISLTAFSDVAGHWLGGLKPQNWTYPHTLNEPEPI